MKAIPEICIPAEEVSRGVAAGAASADYILWRLELLALAGIIVLLNLPLLSGGFADSWAFLPRAVRAGEWWRLFTHPFVHVSWYHLLLDAAAFFLAYSEFRERHRIERLGLVTAAGAGSLLAALWAAPAIFTHGLCGLSGIAHGLTALVGLEMFVHGRDRLSRGAGLVTFVGVVAKCIFEALTGQIAFASWHLGWLGTPIAVCHAGGVLGALAMWLSSRVVRSWVAPISKMGRASGP